MIFTDHGSQKPITFISWTLSIAEKKYSQLENEALAIVFAVKKTAPVSVWLILHLFWSSTIKILVQWSLTNTCHGLFEDSTLGPYFNWLPIYCTIQHRPGAQMANADAVSRLPLSVAPVSVPTPGDLDECLIRINN